MNKNEITDIWNKAVGVVAEICHVAGKYADKELPGSASLVKKIAFSMANSMADGASKKNCVDTVHYISAARRAAAELARQLHESESMRHLETRERLLGEIDGISDALHKLLSGWRVKDAA